MKKLITLLLLGAAGLLPVGAQSVFFKIGGGFASQTGATGRTGSAKISFGYEYEFSQRCAFAPSIGVTGRGWKIPDVSTPDMLFDEEGRMLDAAGQVTTDPALQAQRHTDVLDANGQPVLGPDNKPLKGDPMFSMMHRSYAANYIQLDAPFNYYIRQGESRYITLTAGPWLAVGIAGNRTTEGDGSQPLGRKTRYTDSTFKLDGAHRFDCGLKAGVGYQFPSSLTINLEGELGLLKTNKPTPDFGNRSGRNAALMLTLSYKLNKSKWKADD